MKRIIRLFATVIILSFVMFFGNSAVFAEEITDTVEETADIVEEDDADDDEEDGEVEGVEEGQAEEETTAPATTTRKSADNSLSTLSLSSGSLSPSFKYNTTNYTATVDNSVTKVTVSAKTSNKKAEITSITGGDNLAVGENTIKVTVTAENGAVAVYKIVVTRASEGQTVTPEEPSEQPGNTDVPEDDGGNAEGGEPQNIVDTNLLSDGTYTLNGVVLTLAETIPEEAYVPDFSLTSILVGEKEYPCLSFDKGDLVLVYMTSPEETGNLYVYDAANGIVYNFIRFVNGENYAIAVMPVSGSVPEGFTAATLAVADREVVQAYQLITKEGSNESQFYILYCLNQNGEGIWYQYDSIEGTYQRYVERQTATETAPVQETNEPEEQPEQTPTAKKDGNWQIFFYALIFILAIGLLIGVNLFINKKNPDEDENREDDFFKKTELKRPSEKTIEKTNERKQEKKENAQKKKGAFLKQLMGDEFDWDDAAYEVEEDENDAQVDERNDSENEGVIENGAHRVSEEQGNSAQNAEDIEFIDL